jgi:hypothetical protein
MDKVTLAKHCFGITAAYLAIVFFNDGSYFGASIEATIMLHMAYSMSKPRRK